ncbi:MAG: undecaprenyl/decaprenyl-phosphate alpha-N-acetylglucosaminyl 1-phosphate transferase, partial [Cyclobacteriaceae bacterium]|nr:undecaprenyl/decaprenyl-phosphate alpha-N-acetylglucosaminyl 1-phosphate transferase [Cyclobacteriaceae bacterium]
PLFIKVLGEKKFFDKPDSRKIHQTETVSLGGILILLCAIIPLLFFFPLNELGHRKYFFSAVLIMFIVGLRDDILPLRPIYKLFSQLIPCVVIFFAYDVRLNSLYTLAPMIEFPLLVSFVITCLTIVIITNSYNLIDGVDGLASTLGAVSLGAFSLYFYLTGDTSFSYILLTFIGSILGFLVFNWSPARVFMGDTGALLIGFLLAVASILFINSNFNHEHSYFRATISTALCFIGIPIFDTLRIIIVRLLKGKSPLSADNDHIHHVLQKKGLSHARVTLLLGSIQLILVAIPLLGRSWNEWQFMSLLSGMFLVGYFILWRLSGIKSETEEPGI